MAGWGGGVGGARAGGRHGWGLGGRDLLLRAISAPCIQLYNVFDGEGRPSGARWGRHLVGVAAGVWAEGRECGWSAGRPYSTLQHVSPSFSSTSEGYGVHLAWEDGVVGVKVGAEWVAAGRVRRCRRVPPGVPVPTCTHQALVPFLSVPLW